MTPVGERPRHNRGSLSRLTPHALPLFDGDTLFASIARTLCDAGCLPRKELYEAWEVARRVRRRFRGGRVVDLACGHGLLGYLMLILDDRSPAAIGVDKRIPPCASQVARVLEARWPRLAGRVTLVAEPLDHFPLTADDLVLSVHACGGLTDIVIDRAIDARAKVAVLPCCHALAKQDQGGFQGWLDGALAIDVTRAGRLKQAGYAVRTQTIPDDITPKNRLLIAEPVGDPI